eukprot:TRINITY_DN16520_c0_g2_i1.p1 TRINITY_DN16520_c0_g2~~TRINITY_DN16520_c0_g2_i1.p1  ORF type:complete len:689 (-),score=77.49 TRINITY_DN16520_c0_g2_i1:96-2162(-)
MVASGNRSRRRAAANRRERNESGCAETFLVAALPATMAAAACKAALAKDEKESHDPLLEEVSSYLCIIVQGALRAPCASAGLIREAAAPILAGAKWDEARIDGFVCTLWEASVKASARLAGTSAPSNPSSLRAPQSAPASGSTAGQSLATAKGMVQKSKDEDDLVFRARAVLADFAADELAREETEAERRKELKKKRAQKRQMRARCARQDELQQMKSLRSQSSSSRNSDSEASDNSDIASSGLYEASLEATRIARLSSDVAVADTELDDEVEDEVEDRCEAVEEIDAVNIEEPSLARQRSGKSRKPREPSTKWTVKNYSEGVETTWDVTEGPNGTVRSMKITGHSSTQSAGRAGSHSKSFDTKDKSSYLTMTLSCSATSDGEADLSPVAEAPSSSSAFCGSMPQPLVEEAAECVEASSSKDVLRTPALRCKESSLPPLSPTVGEERVETRRPSDLAASTAKSGQHVSSTVDAPGSPAPPLLAPGGPHGPVFSPSIGCCAAPIRCEDGSASSLDPIYDERVDAAPSHSSFLGNRPRALSASSSATASPALAPGAAVLPRPGAVGSRGFPTRAPPSQGDGVRARAGSFESTSLYSRQISWDSFTATDDVTAQTPSAPWPSTPEATFMLPPPGISDSAPRAASKPPSPRIVYVPVMVPHRCRHCGEQCVPAEPLPFMPLVGNAALVPPLA